MYNDFQGVMQAVTVGVVLDSAGMALDISGDVFFTATAEYYDRLMTGKSNNSLKD